MSQREKGSSRAARRRQGVALLASGMPVTHVAEKLGVRRETVHRWQRDHADELDQHAEEAARSIGEQLQELNGAAVEALQELLASQDDKVRLQAARTVLSRAGYPEGKEMDMRVSSLEGKSVEELLEEYERMLQALKGAQGAS